MNPLAKVTISQNCVASPIHLAKFSAVSTLLSQLKPQPSKVFVIVDKKVSTLYGSRIRSGLKSLDIPSQFIFVTAKERFKTPMPMMKLCQQMVESGVDRHSLVLAIGGGVTTDMAGFASAITLRGIRWIAVPTTLLGMIDAAIGGKTGVNTGMGKNQLGAFHQPHSVLIDTTFCESQAERDFKDGLAEALKYSLIAGKPSLKSIDSLLRHGSADSKILQQVIRRCASIKARIVSSDPLESGIRAHLNFGHTIGHAIEYAAGYGAVSHGSAVAAGMLGALHISKTLGMPNSASCSQAEALARQIAIGKRASLSVPRVEKALWSDKKRQGSAVRFVLLKAIRKPYLHAEVESKLVREAIAISIESLSTHLPKRK